MEVTSENDGVRCYIRHVRAAKLCHQGARRWCDAHDIGWQDFLDHGILAQRLHDTGDPIVMRVVTEAMREAGHVIGR